MWRSSRVSCPSPGSEGGETVLLLVRLRLLVCSFSIVASFSTGSSWRVREVDAGFWRWREGSVWGRGGGGVAGGLDVGLGVYGGRSVCVCNFAE